jgi:hypothetical protein
MTARGNFRPTLHVCATVSNLRNLRVLDLAVWKQGERRYYARPGGLPTSNLSVLTHLINSASAGLTPSRASSIWIFDSLGAALP